MRLNQGSWSGQTILDYPGGCNVITRILMSKKGRKNSQKKRYKEKSRSQIDVALRQIMLATLRSWKRQENEFTPKASRRNAFLPTPWFCLIGIMFGLLSFRIVKWFFVVVVLNCKYCGIHFNSNRRLIYLWRI